MRKLTLLLCLFSPLAMQSVRSAQTVVLPAWVCAHPDSVFAGGFEGGEAPVPRAPSNGSGGNYPWNSNRNITVPGLTTQRYYLYVPTKYDPRYAWPLVVALHGAGGPGTADMYARTVRSDWGAVSEGFGFIVAAPVGTDTQGGGWIAPSSPSEHPTDYDIIAAVFADVAAAYNIETTRRYGWGYSSGGHVMHSLALNGFNATVNADSLAAYSVSAGVTGADSPTGWACRGLTGTQCMQQVLLPATRKVPVDIHIGDTDPLLSYAQEDETNFAAAGWTLGGTLFFTEFNGGHVYSSSDLQEMWGHMCPNAVVP